MNENAKVVVVNILVLSVLLLIIEIALSMIAPFNFASVGHKHSPNAVKYGWGWRPNEIRKVVHADTKEIVEITMNNNAWHDSPRTFENPDKKYRTLVIGDSETYAGGAGITLENMFTKLLESKLEKIGISNEVINISCGGWGTDHELEALVTEGIQYQPDLIICQFTLNDLTDIIRSDSVSPFNYYLNDNNKLKRRAVKSFNKSNETSLSKKIISKSEILKRLYAMYISNKYKEEYSFASHGVVYKVHENEIGVMADLFGEDRFNEIKEVLLSYSNQTLTKDTIELILEDHGFSGSKDTILKILQNNYFDDHWNSTTYFCEAQDTSHRKWKLYEALIKQMQTEAKAIDAEFAILVTTEEGSYEWEAEWFRIKNDSTNRSNYLAHMEIIQDICSRNNIHYIPNSVHYKTFTNDPHKNELGHQQVATDVFNYMIENQIVSN